jgi:hypothetical protein
MYGRKGKTVESPSSDKNPNRVTGGLRAQGADSYKIIAEDGSTQEIPTQAYVRSLENQVKKQRAAINVLERKAARQDSEIANIKLRIRP